MFWILSLGPRLSHGVAQIGEITSVFNDLRRNNVIRVLPASIETFAVYLTPV